MKDIMLKDAGWLSEKGEWKQGHIYIRGEQIRSLAESRQKTEIQAGHILEGLDCFVLPGIIDSHTHLREPGQAYKEGIVNGSRAALKGGVTTILDMPNNKPPCTNRVKLQAKKRLFEKKSQVNWGLHLQADLSQVQKPGDGYASAKIYMAKSSEAPAINSVEALRAIFKRFPVVSLHGEDETEFAAGVVPKSLYSGHHRLRPKKALINAIAKIETAYFAVIKPLRPRIILCHVSTREEVQWLLKMKDRGADIWGETCPHYCLLTQTDYEKAGNPLKVNPPLRTDSDRAALIEALKTGGIDFISSDHAPHLPVEKADPFEPPSGIAGIEWLTPLIFYLQENAGISWASIFKLICGNAARCFSIPNRNGIRPGNFADLVLVRPRPIPPISQAFVTPPVITRARYQPYQSLDLKYQVQTTLVNGNIAYHQGIFCQEVRGKEVYP